MLIRDFITFSSDDLTRLVTVCASLQEYSNDSDVTDIADLLAGNFAKDFLKGCEMHLNSAESVKTLLGQAEKGQISPRFVKLVKVIKLILRLVDALIANINWEMTLESITNKILSESMKEDVRD
jgi:hypothetical protein